MTRLAIGSRRWTLLRNCLQQYSSFTNRLLSTSIRPAPNAKRRVSLSITKLNSHGDGVGTFISEDDTELQVIVPFTAPGDKLIAEIWEQDMHSTSRKKPVDSNTQDIRSIFGQQVKLLESSNYRVNPLCTKYFGDCGGCNLQHVRYEQQLREKQQWIINLFSQRHHSLDMEICNILGVKIQDGIYHYRNKMEFTCSTGRWLLDEDKNSSDRSSQETIASSNSFTVGMFPVSSVHSRRLKQRYGKNKARRRRVALWSPRILSIKECQLQDLACNELLQRFVQKCEINGLSAYNFITHKGFLKQIVLRRGVNSRGQIEIMLGLKTTEWYGEESDLLHRIVQDLASEVEKTSLVSDENSPRLVSIIESLDQEAERHRRREDDVASQLIENHTLERVLYGKAHLEDTILDHKFEIPFNSFFQPNSVQASLLYYEIQRMIVTLPEKPIVWDLFCGVGSIGICMGAYVKQVMGFELNDEAVERAKVNARLNGYTSDHMRFFRVDLAKSWHEKDFFELLASHSIDYDLPDLIIVDPPRAGLHRKLIEMLRRMTPRYICYVSCNPHSQVVDLEVLCAKVKLESGQIGYYKVRRLQPVDMLPHTPHVETMAWLELCE
ncbi:putative (Uracil-5)-methyltransferase family, S-adenosyl-L-methionine-dependent methyltransferase [Plasmopara halstedii]